MPLRFQFRRYRLPLRATVRTAHEVWTDREGVIVRVEDESGRVGYGEAAPIPAFGTETVDAVEEAGRELGEWPRPDQLAAVPPSLGCLRHAIAAAMRKPAENSDVATPATEPTANATAANYRAVAALLPAGRAVLEQLPLRVEAGFRVFKWKVGVGDAADELALLDDVCSLLPGGAKLRLDANGGWDRRLAERWLERCAERPIEFVEQPCFAAKAEGATSRRRAEDVMLGLAHDYPTPLALDESLVGDGDVERWLGAGWPGWYVIKPSLLADVDAALARLHVARATVVFSSALETALGARDALSVAFAWPGEPKALGFGVWPLFADARFDGPAAAPFVRVQDVQRINPEAVWNALS